jgi:outer membrane protein OmpA-like peptidoglycan-associated protein
MKILNVAKLFLPVIAVSLTVGCSGPLPKSQGVIAAESAYQKAHSNPDILRYAKSDLNKANATLQAAAKTESAEEMASLAFIADLQIKTATSVTESKLGELKFKQLTATKDAIVTNALKNKNQQLQQEVSLFEKQAEQARVEERQRLDQQLAALKDKEISRNLKFILGDVLFVTNKADLVPGATSKITEIADMMKLHPNKTIIIEGHTDNTGAEEYNLELSQKRAGFVKNALVQKGIINDRIIARGMGQAFPIASNDTAKGRQENRRIEISVQN